MSGYKVYSQQLSQLEIKNIDLDIKFLVVVVADTDQLDNKTIKSLQGQVYKNFETYICDINKMTINSQGKLDALAQNEKIIMKFVQECIKKAKAEYVYFIHSGNELAPHALLRYAEALSEKKYDVVYADEVINSKEGICKLKPDFSPIYMCYELYQGEAITVNADLLLEIADKIICSKVQSIVNEIFIRAAIKNCNFKHIPEILHLTDKFNKIEDLELFKIKTVIQEYLDVNGSEGEVLSKYEKNVNHFYLSSEKNINKVSYLIVVEDLNRSKRLIKQICRIDQDSKIFLVTSNENWKLNILKFANKQNNNNIIVYKKDFKSYAEAIGFLGQNISEKITIVLRDIVEKLWELNSNITGAMLENGVSAVSPKLVTAEKNEKIIYAGGVINSLDFSVPLYYGEVDSVYRNDGVVNGNREVLYISSICYAIRTKILKEISKFPKVINTAEQVAMELSLLIGRRKKICVYLGQEIVSVHKEYLKKNSRTIYKITDKGCMWHFLYNYGDIFEQNTGNIPWLIREQKPYLPDIFKMYGLNDIIASNAENKKVLVYTHELSMTGAPIVLIQAVDVLQKHGFELIVISPVDGPLREIYLQKKIPVIIEPQLEWKSRWITFVNEFTFVIVSTIVPFKSIKELSRTKIPVLWWIHDARLGYENYLQYVLPQRIGKNIHLYCGGGYAKSVINEYRPLYKADVLLYGLEDKAIEKYPAYELNIPRGKVLFSSIGAIDFRKGQDILVEAIRLLPKEIIERSHFLFIGGICNHEIKNKIDELNLQYPESITYINQVDRDSINSIYEQSDCLICSSRDDPMPAFATEGMMFSKIVICSEYTGTAFLMEDMKNGFLYKNNSEKELSEKIKYVVENNNVLGDMKKASRKIFNDYFTMDIFEEKFMNIVTQKMIGDMK